MTILLLSLLSCCLAIYLYKRYFYRIQNLGCSLARRKSCILKNQNLPKHVAIIMDGNGRWAKKKGKKRLFGHLNGTKNVETAINACLKLNIPYLTLHTFTTENWQRPQEEVTGLMNLLRDTIKDKLEYLIANNIKLKVIGDINPAPEDCKHMLTEAIKATSNNDQLTLTLCIGYGGRWDITQAIQALSYDIIHQKIQVSDITEVSFVNYLSTANTPDPDLVIRTGGEMRISNFLIWQIAYAELLIIKKYWPDFHEGDFYNAIVNYQKRNRRFGKIV